MLKSLFEQLALEHGVFNVFRYLSFRAICAVLTALAFSFIAGPVLIKKLAVSYTHLTLPTKRIV